MAERIGGILYNLDRLGDSELDDIITYELDVAARALSGVAVARAEKQRRNPTVVDEAFQEHVVGRMLIEGAITADQVL